MSEDARSEDSVDAAVRHIPMNYCDCPNCKTTNCPSGAEAARMSEAYELAFNELKAENARMRDALTELRRWVADGDCSDDAGIWPGYATTAYKAAIKQADDALSNAAVTDGAERNSVH